MDEQGEAARLRRLWDRYAPRYDRDMGFFERLQFGGVRAWVCSQAAGEVLEVAIGTGRNLPFYPQGVTLTGIDLSPAMLGIARRRAADLGHQPVLREADAQALPFPDASFDTVVCTLGLCGVPDDRAAIAEIHRVLRPGGILLLLDHVGSHHTLIRLGQRLLEKPDPAHARRLPDPPAAATGRTGWVRHPPARTAQSRHGGTGRRRETASRPVTVSPPAHVYSRVALYRAVTGPIAWRDGR